MSHPVRNILLLTATILPMPGLPALARTDPALRLQDYAHALTFYLSQLKIGAIDRIVFAENSNADISSLKALATEHGLQAQVEFISFFGLDFPPTKGRGFGEFKLVDHAMAHSQTVAQHPDAIVWKCTGRYTIRNLASLIKKAPKGFDLHCHCRNHPTVWCELYMMAWSKRGYQELIKDLYPKLANDVVPGQHTFEEVRFREHVDKAPSHLKIAPRFKVVPLIDGTRGWNNSRYSDRWYSPKLLARQVAAVLLPSLWI